MPSMDTLPPYRAPNYIVWRDGNYYRALNGVTGEIQFQSLDPGQCVIQAFTAGGASCVVELKEGTFTAVVFSFAFTANNQWLRGQGDGTFLDCDALLTGVHGITLNGYTGCTISDFSIQTEDGAGKTCYCLWIANGANDFHVINVTAIDSDDDAFAVTGTTITQGHFHNCHILGADSDGITVDMAAGNFMYRLHITDCDIGNVDGRGLWAVTSGGNLYWQVTNNIFYSCGSNGVLLYVFDHSIFEGNISILNGSSGVEVQSTTYCKIDHNITSLNVRHGILFVGVLSSSAADNHSIGNDSGDTGTYSGISLSGSSKNNIHDNHCDENDDWGIIIDLDSDFNKVKDNYTDRNTAGSIRVNNANCDGNQLEFNTVEEGAPGDVGTLTRSYGNFDPSANAFVGDVGAAPF